MNYTFKRDQFLCRLGADVSSGFTLSKYISHWEHYMKTRRLWIEVNNLFLKMLLVNSSFWEVLFEVLFCMINPVVVVKEIF